MPGWYGFGVRRTWDKTKFFTEQVTSGSRGEASDEDMQHGITDFGAEEMPDDSTFFIEGLSASQRLRALGPYVACPREQIPNPRANERPRPRRL